MFYTIEEWVKKFFTTEECEKISKNDILDDVVVWWRPPGSDCIWHKCRYAMVKDRPAEIVVSTEAGKPPDNYRPKNYSNCD